MIPLNADKESISIIDLREGASFFMTIYLSTAIADNLFTWDDSHALTYGNAEQCVTEF